MEWSDTLLAAELRHSKGEELLPSLTAWAPVAVQLQPQNSVPYPSPANSKAKTCSESQAVSAQQAAITPYHQALTPFVNATQWLCSCSIAA